MDGLIADQVRLAASRSQTPQASGRIRPSTAPIGLYPDQNRDSAAGGGEYQSATALVSGGRENIFAPGTAGHKAARPSDRAAVSAVTPVCRCCQEGSVTVRVAEVPVPSLYPHAEIAHNSYTEEALRPSARPVGQPPCRCPRKSVMSTALRNAGSED